MFACMGLLVPLNIPDLALIDVGSARGSRESMLIYLGHAFSGCSQSRVLTKSTKIHS